MYIDYGKLWKTLLERDMNKTELAQAAGLSSRTLAKLSKNQTVTTDTLLRICETLNCNIYDIVDFIKEPTATSIYDAYKHYGKIVAENEFFITTTFDYQEKHFKVMTTKQKANNNTRIHCRNNGDMIWEQVYPVGITPLRVPNVIGKPKVEGGVISIFVIIGNPNLITGIDENNYYSSHYEEENPRVIVMSQATFKCFALE